MVIHAVRDVAAALSNLIQATKNASGRSLQDPAMNYLKEAAKVCYSASVSNSNWWCSRKYANLNLRWWKKYHITSI